MHWSTEKKRSVHRQQQTLPNYDRVCTYVCIFSNKLRKKSPLLVCVVTVFGFCFPSYVITVDLLPPLPTPLLSRHTHTQLLTTWQRGDLATRYLPPITTKTTSYKDRRQMRGGVRGKKNHLCVPMFQTSFITTDSSITTKWNQPSGLVDP